jgi:transcription antitermination factor NusG
VSTVKSLSSEQLDWFALFVRSKRERVVQRDLHNRGYETYVPLGLRKRRWADRVKLAEVPLFPNYVFCRFDPYDRLPVVSVPAVYSVVGSGKEPLPIPVEEIDAVRRAVQYGGAVEPTEHPLAGQRARIASGPLGGLEGTVIKVKGTWRLIIMLTLLQRGIAVEIDRECVDVIRPSTADAATCT